jgi:rhodanese-related sulfurtransferase
MERLPEFISQQLPLVLAFVGLTVFLAVGLVGRFTRGYREVTPAELTMLINRENALVVDISAIAEFEKAHIPGSRHVAPSQFDPESKDLAKVKDKPVAVVCRSGISSRSAAKRLVKAGFTRVHSLSGGVAQWQAAELPVARGKA